MIKPRFNSINTLYHHAHTYLSASLSEAIQAKIAKNIKQKTKAELFIES